MKKLMIRRQTILLIALLIVGCEKVTPNMELSQHLKPLQQYIGKTFKGEFADLHLKIQLMMSNIGNVH